MPYLEAEEVSKLREGRLQDVSNTDSLVLSEGLLHIAFHSIRFYIFVS